MDRNAWKGSEDGQFSVNSAYWARSNIQDDNPNRVEGHMGMEWAERFRVHMWKVAYGCLLTNIRSVWVHCSPDCKIVKGLMRLVYMYFATLLRPLKSGFIS